MALTIYQFPLVRIKYYLLRVARMKLRANKTCRIFYIQFNWRWKLYKLLNVGNLVVINRQTSYSGISEISLSSLSTRPKISVAKWNLSWAIVFDQVANVIHSTGKLFKWCWALHLVKHVIYTDTINCMVVLWIA